jgi:hypothetical protein
VIYTPDLCKVSKNKNYGRNNYEFGKLSGSLWTRKGHKKHSAYGTRKISFAGNMADNEVVCA